MNIGKKLSFTHLGLILLITVVVNMIGYSLTTSTLQQAQTERLQLLANEFVYDFQDTLAEMSDTVGTLADSRAMAIYIEDFNDRPLRTLLRQQSSWFDDIAIVDESGAEEFSLIHSIFSKRNRSYTLEQSFLDARWIPNTTSIQLTPGAADEAARISFTYVKKNFFDEFGGAVRAGIGVQELLHGILQSPENTFVLVLDPNGRVVYRHDSNDQLPAPDTPLECNHLPDNGAMRSDCLGFSAFQLRRMLNEDGWSLLVGVSHQDFIAPIMAIRNAIGIALLAVMIIAIFISLLLARHIQQPLSALVSASKRLAQGDRNVKVEVRRNDEIGDLAQAFNQMSFSLQQSNEQRDQALQGMSLANQELKDNLEELSQAQARIEYMAYNDELTGLANRRLLMDYLDQTLASAIRHGHRGALLMLDLDRFKNINDSLGHDAGDKLIVQVGERLNRAVRDEDIVCRLGGDEFVVLFPQIESDNDDIIGSAMKAAEKIRGLLAEPYQLGRHRYRATPSIGLVLFPRINDDAEGLLKRADTAMYRAKRDGGNKACFYEVEMQIAADERLHLEKDLLHAFANNELFLAYQSQCDGDGRVVGAETLLRWHHPENGMISPAKFIPVAEETGLIIALGTWILEQACRDMSALVSQNNAARLPAFTVNVSPYQFRDDGFSETVLKALHEYHIPAGALKLELTETALLHDVAYTIARMLELRDAGVRFSLDDFGTGYSSLSYLNTLPLDELKIDRSFLTSSEDNPRAWALIESILSIAEALELEVVVEGVEQEGVVNKLRSIGFNCFQGFYFAKPQDFNSFRNSLTGQFPKTTVQS